MKCDFCYKKLGLIKFNCKCGGFYCTTHRLSNVHGCNYDFREEAKKQLSQSLPKIKAEKIEKI